MTSKLLKILTPIIVAALGAYATIKVTYMQTTNVTKEDLQKVYDATYEKQFGAIQQVVQDLQKDIIGIRERLAKIEGASEARRAIRTTRLLAGTAKPNLVETLMKAVEDKKEVTFEIPKTNVQKVLEQKPNE